MTAVWYRRLYERREFDRIIDDRMIFLAIAGGLGIFQILLILSKKAPRGWAEREALTEARRHGGVRYVNHEFFE